MTTWRVVCSGELYNIERWANVFHIAPSGSFNHAEVMDAFENVYSQNASGGGLAWLFPCPGDVVSGTVGVHMSFITLQRVTDPDVPEIRAVNHQGEQNTAGGLPVDVSPVISWRTSRAGKSYRGRTYLPVWHENQNVDTAGFPTPLNTSVIGVCKNAARLIEDLAAADAPLAIYSRLHLVATDVTGGYMDYEWDTQRRRGKQHTASRNLFAPT